MRHETRIPRDGRDGQPQPRRRRTAVPFPHRALAVAIRMLIGSGAALAGPAAHAQLPIACAAGTCGASGPAAWVGAGAATRRVTGNTLEVNQTSESVILNWARFDVGHDNAVRFRQPDAAALALNRIYQSDPSRILGTLSANGQVYLINQNGIVFGPGARVDVGTLVASSLQMSDLAVQQGILTPAKQGLPAFSGTGGAITVERGARLRAASGGRVMILAPNIVNRGVIETPDGQTLLAAGNKIYLSASTDPRLRGLLVEVDADAVTDPELRRFLKGETATLSAGAVANLGRILAGRGNVTLMGLAVNQSGEVSATTAVDANGSIELLARDRVAVKNIGGTFSFNPTRTGAVTFGAGSVTRADPLAADPKTAVDDQVQQPSTVTAIGHRVHLESGSLVSARSGRVTLQALADPQQAATTNRPIARNDSRVQIDAGARVDVSGLDVTLPAARNLVQVELRGNELRDSPLQRNGVLRGKTVTVDIRKGTPLADIRGALANIRRTVAERSTRGGTVTLDSEGDVVVQPGAAVDVSGGAVHYQAGFLQTSQLLSRGRVYDIGSADPNRVYDGVLRTYTQTLRRWGITRTFDILSGRSVAGTFSPAYTQGADAGTLAVLGRGLQLAGAVRGTRRVGPFQRAAGALPRSGALVIGDPTGGAARALPVPDYRAPAVVFGAAGAATFGVHEALPPGLPLTLDAHRLLGAGIGRLAVYSNGAVAVPAGTDLALPAGGALTLSGRRVTLGDAGAGAAPVAVSAPGGTVRLAAVDNFEPGDGRGAGVFLGAGTRLFAGGRWINDNPLIAGPDPVAPAPIDGGAVALSVGAADGVLHIGDGVVIDVSGGAWRDASGAVRPGRGGSVSLDADALRAGFEIGRGVRLQGYGVDAAAGGRLTVRAPQVRIAASGADALPAQRSGAGTTPLRLADALFATGGFGAYAVSATGGRLHPAGGGLPPLVVAGDVRVRAARRELTGSLDTVPTGTPLTAVGRVNLPPEALRAPADLTLRVAPSAAQNVGPRDFGDLVVAAGARIAVDPGGAVTLSTGAPRGIVVDGVVAAPAGAIRLRIDNPTGSDPGFVPGQAIRLGPEARLDARGAVVLTPNARGLRLGRVLAGGTVELHADRGAIVTAPGSRIDVSGTAAALDPAPAARAAGAPGRMHVAGDAGAVVLQAPEGMVLGGALAGHPGAGGTAAGGALTLAVTRKAGFQQPAVPPSPFPGAPRVLVLGAAPGGDAFSGTAAFDPARAVAGGFDRLTLTADDAIRFARDLDLHLRAALALAAPVLQADPGVTRVALAAPYIALGPDNPFAQGGATAAGGGAALEVRAGLLDLIGRSALRGWRTARLASRGDLRLRGVAPAAGSPLDGALAAAGDLTLEAARVYPTTFSRFTLTLAAPAAGAAGGTLHLTGGGDPAAPLSAAGAVTVRAPNIEQAGVLAAPLGTLDLEATGTLTLAPGSVTSTSAQGRVLPFGQTLDSGRRWVYDGFGDLESAPTIDTPPAPRVRLAGADVTVAGGARVDLRGGGDLFAYEFIPGPGGSKDALAPANAPDTYAILPGLDSPWAPFDTQYYLGSGLRPGDGVELAGGAGLAAGRYALLPARYALLPGAYLVRAVGGFRDLQPGQRAVLADGSPVVAGRRVVAGTDIRAARWSGFAVRPGRYARRLAEYADHFASTFFAGAAQRAGTPPPRLPADAGTLAIVAGRGLTLQGTLGSAAATGGRGAQVDLVAPRIEVTGAAAAAGPVAADGTVRVAATRLAALGAGSLLIGASRSAAPDGVRLDVGAGTVRIAPGVHLNVPELMLAARDTVSVGAGASLRAAGPVTGSPRPLILGRGGDGDGALLRLAAGPQATLVRENRSGARGTLEVGAGAVLAADGSMILDATRDTRSAGRIELPAGGALRLSASTIRLGAVAGVDGGGLALSNADLARLGALGELALSSRGSIDLYGAVRLGDAAPGGSRPGTLLLEGAGLRAGAAPAPGAAARLSAGTIRLTNPDGVAPAPAAAPAAGTLSLQADRIRLESGDYAIAGYGTVRLQARSVTGVGTAHLGVGGDLDLAAASFDAAAGADLTVDASGHSVRLAAGAGAPAAPAGLGARIAVRARDLVVAGRIDLPAGLLRLAADGDLTLAAGADLRLGGVDRTLGGATVSTPGGRLQLESAAGSVRVAAGARVDVSGAPGGADAGRVAVRAPAGTADVQGTLRGTAAAGHRQGSFSVYAGDLTAFADLNAALNRGGFTRERSIRTARGDLVVGAAETVRARELHLSADGGSIAVQGVLDASGDHGGRVRLDARGDVTVAAGARIDAHATATGGRGGRVALATTHGQLDVQAGSRIDVSGPGAGGRIELRAPQLARTPGGVMDEVAVRALAGTLVGADSVRVEAFRRYDAASLDATQRAAWRADAQSFSSFAPAVAARLGHGTDPAFTLVPGIEVDGAGDLTLASDWDLSAWRFAGVPGVLTLRARGNLMLDASLSDGFSGTRPDATFGGGDSWSYRLVAGADPLAADPLAVLPAEALSAGGGGVHLAAGRLVRTGSGAIDVAAGGDVTLGDAGSVIYTAGVPAVPSVRGSGGFFSRPVTRNWPTGGGDLTIRAGRDVRGVAGDQLVTGWLRRRGGGSRFGRTVPTEWALAFSEFRQGVGALGGGDVRIRAGRDVDNLAASVPTTGLKDTAGAIRSWGGGDLSVDAGRDIRSGLFFVGRGNGHLYAGGAVTSGRTANGNPVHTFLALGAGAIDLTARRDLQLETVFNPTVSGQPNGTGIGDTSVFFTYAPDSAVRLLSLSGDLALVNNSTAVEQSARSVRFNPTAAVFVYPPTLRAAAPAGTIDLNGALWLYPSARGGLDLLAGGDVRATGATVGVSDGDPALLPGPVGPDANYTRANLEITFNHAARPLHAGDPEPVRVVAAGGDLRGGNWRLPKAARVIAGRDVVDFNFQGQNANAGDVTVVQAGRDLRYDGTSISPEIRLGGPGRLAVSAGRDIDLGFSAGITTIGNAVNGALPVRGADVTVLAGLARAPAYDAFAARYFAPGARYSPLLTAAMRARSGDPSLSPADALARFRALPPLERRPLILQAFYTELRDAGRAASAGAGFQRGFDAIRTLFPGSDYRGDLNMFFSRIYTLAGGDINLLVPGGRVNAGLANPPANLGQSKSPSDLGIVAQGPGSVRAFTRDDFLVNQSRVFTLQGGDILIWSSRGNIDAGRGAKTAISAPPPQLIVDARGNVRVDFSNAVAGSGIRAIVTREGVTPGSVDLVAPAGVVNAGDAGIGSAGNLNIAAVSVLGAQNIQVSGTVTGVPVANTGALAASLSGVSNLTGSVSQIAQQSLDTLGRSDRANAAGGPGALSFLTVQFLGFGE